MVIYTHSGFAHVDDFLSVAVLLSKFPEAEVHRVSELPELSEEDIVVDIGGRHDGERFFDHHHDPNLPASVVLVLKKFFPEIDTENVEELKWISDWDTLGPVKTQQKWGVKLPPFEDPVVRSLLNMFSRATVIKPGDAFHSFMVEFGKSFVTLLKENTENIEKARKAETFTVKNLKIVRISENIPIRFIKNAHPSVAIIIQPNPRTPNAVSLIRVDDHPQVDFNRIRGKVPAHFIHANGFMAVVDSNQELITKALEIAIQ
uniref:MYG1 family protein n=1 Tax=Archaeoglobus fulgidus TaxID=2234 RepID=A0A7C2NAN0_ARCFL